MSAKALGTERVLDQIDPKGQTTSVTFSARGEQQEPVFADGTRISFTHDALGQMTEARDALGITSQTFDARGLLSTVRAPGHPNGVPISYLHDETGSRAAMVLGADRHSWTYDARQQNTVYLDPEGGRASWAWDAASQLVEQQHPNGAATSWTYDPRGLVQGVRHRKSDGTEIGSDQYVWDANGNPVSKRTPGGLNAWGYDALDQLSSEHHEVGLVTSWTYDGARNRLSQDRSQAGVRTLTNYALDMADQLVTATEGASVTSFTFDANGNQRTEQSPSGIKSYTWNPRNLLTGFSQGSQGAVFSHRYDGLRASIDPGGGSAATKLVWDPLGPTGYVDLLAETLADQSLARQYWRGERLVSYKEPAQKGVYLFDHLK